MSSFSETVYSQFFHLREKPGMNLASCLQGALSIKIYFTDFFTQNRNLLLLQSVIYFVSSPKKKFVDRIFIKAEMKLFSVKFSLIITISPDPVKRVGCSVGLGSLKICPFD
jgi:hypothetical protein